MIGKRWFSVVGGVMWGVLGKQFDPRRKLDEFVDGIGLRAERLSIQSAARRRPGNRRARRAGAR